VWKPACGTRRRVQNPAHGDLRTAWPFTSSTLLYRCLVYRILQYPSCGTNPRMQENDVNYHCSAAFHHF
jgi:hypothetical protein